MPGNDQADDRLGPTDRGRVSRRSLLGAAGAGAAGLAAGAFAGLASATPATSKTASAAHTGAGGERPDSGQQVVVHVRSGRGGALDVFSGTSHTRVQDAALAARLRQMIQ